MTPSFKNLSPLQYQQSHIRSLGWTVESLRERIRSMREAQIKWKRENWNKSYRQIGVAWYLKYKNMLRILETKE
jgi:hypothetical protein